MNSRGRRKFSALGERLRREEAAEIAKLTPAERLRLALKLSDFCRKLAKAGRKARAREGTAESRKNAR